METLRINFQLEEEATAWDKGEKGLLTGPDLWHAGRYSRSGTYRAADLSNLARAYVDESMRVNEADFLGTARLRDRCRGCGENYRSENLLICLECSMERCGACASRFERNDHGDPVCPYCGGILA